MDESVAETNINNVIVDNRIQKLEQEEKKNIIDGESFDAKGRTRMSPEHFKHFEFLYHVMKMSKFNAKCYCVMKWIDKEESDKIEKWQDWLPIVEKNGMLESSDEESGYEVYEDSNNNYDSDDDEKYDHYYSKHDDPLNRLPFH
jgi:hypothetical protein